MLRLIAVVGTGLSLTAAGPRVDQLSPPRPDADVVAPGAVIRIDAVGTPRDGATGRPKTWWERTLVVGESATRRLAAGTADDPDVCHMAFVRPGMEPPARVAWEFEITLLSVSADGTRVRVSWTKTVHDIAGDAPGRTDVSRDISLRPGKDHVLDYAENRADSPSSCANLVVRLTAVPRVVPQVVRTATVDLWLVEEQGGVPTRSIHQRVVGAVGHDVPYQMSSLDYPVTVNDGASRGEAPAVRLAVSGTVRVEPATEGQVDVAVTAWRKCSYGKRWAEGGGKTLARPRIGDTVAFLLPDPTGNLTGSEAVAGQLLEGVARRDGLLVIDLARLLAGRHLALYVKVDSIR